MLRVGKVRVTKRHQNKGNFSTFSETKWASNFQGVTLKRCYKGSIIFQQQLTRTCRDRSARAYPIFAFPVCVVSTFCSDAWTNILKLPFYGRFFVNARHRPNQYTDFTICYAHAESMRQPWQSIGSDAVLCNYILLYHRLPWRAAFCGMLVEIGL